MPEPVLRTVLTEGMTGALADFQTVYAWHNSWIQSGGARMLLPTDFTPMDAGGVSNAVAFDPSGVGTATANGRYCGATISGAPTAGVFLLGDWIVDQQGNTWTCVAGGNPGTWRSGTAVPTQLGGLVVLGHSWTTGAGNPTQRRYYGDVISDIMTLIGVHDDSLLHLGTGGGSIAGSVEQPPAGPKYGNYAGVLQLAIPPGSKLLAMPTPGSSVNMTDVIPPRPLLFMHGLNDVTLSLFPTFGVDHGLAGFTNCGLKAFLNGALTSISMGMASYVQYYDDGTIAYGGSGVWADLLSQSGNSYKGVKFNSAAGAVATITLPRAFPGGWVGVRLLCTAGGCGTLQTAMNSTDVSTVIALQSARGLPTSGNFMIRIGSENMIVTAGQGTASITVTRGSNGTTKATHSIGDAIFVENINGTAVTWGGTANLVGGGTPGGTTCVEGQGADGQVMVVTKRFNLTAAAATKTITVTLGTVKANGALFVDGWHMEHPIGNPVVIVNTVKYPYLDLTGFTVTKNNNRISAIGTLNTALATMMSNDFGVGRTNVRLADLEAEFAKSRGTLGAAIVTSPAPDTQEVITISPAAGATAWPPASGGFSLRIDDEDMWVESVSGTSYTVRRGYNGTARSTHLINAPVYDRTLFSWDDIHPSSFGGAAIAALIFDKFTDIIASQVRTVGAAPSGRVTRRPTQATPHVPDSFYITAPCIPNLAPTTTENPFSSLTAASGGQGLYSPGQNAVLKTGVPPKLKQIGHYIFIPHRLVVKRIGFYIFGSGQANTVMRCGIWGLYDDLANPSFLLKDFGQVATTSGGWKETGDDYLLLDEGWYIVGGTAQGSGATPATYYVGNGWLNHPHHAANPTLANIPAHYGFAGTLLVGDNTALADWGTVYDVPRDGGSNAQPLVPRFSLLCASHRWAA